MSVAVFLLLIRQRSALKPVRCGSRNKSYQGMKRVKWVINPAALRMCYSIGETVDLPDSIADGLLDSGAVELVASDEPHPETATAKTKPETATAKPQRKR